MKKFVIGGLCFMSLCAHYHTDEWIDNLLAQKWVDAHLNNDDTQKTINNITDEIDRHFYLVPKGLSILHEEHVNKIYGNQKEPQLSFVCAYDGCEYNPQFRYDIISARDHLATHFKKRLDDHNSEKKYTDRIILNNLLEKALLKMFVQLCEKYSKSSKESYQETCILCGKELRSLKGAFLRHPWSHLNTCEFSCSYCDQPFRSPYSMYNHVARKHKKIITGHM